MVETSPETDHEEDDFELLERWHRGDSRSGNVLLARHQSAVRSFLRKSTTAEEAEELAQRTFLAFLEAKARFRRDSAVRTFLLGIAQRQLYAHYRRRLRDHKDATGLVTDDPASPLGALLSSERESRIRGTLLLIPPELRDVVRMYYWEDLNTGEIAALLRVPVGTVASRLRRAKTKILEQLPGGLCSGLTHTEED